MTQFHIGIRDGKELRRNLLESLKAVVGSLQQYDEFHKQRILRDQEVARLRKLLKEIAILNAKLSSEMPRSKASRVMPPKRMPRTVAAAAKDDVTTEGAKRLSKISKLSRLSKKLSSIEEELKKAG